MPVVSKEVPAMNRLTPEFKAEFGQLMDEALDYPPNEFLQKGLDILRKHKLLIEKVMIHPKQMLCHKENRGRLMLNPRKAHRNGARILGIGADKNQLSLALCCELAPSGPTRLANIHLNEQLVHKSHGLLAPVTGDESYISLSCSHTAAFCKVAPLCPKTPYTQLQDQFGKLDYGKICNQTAYKEMCEVGWTWIVVPWDVDLAYPQFAARAQQALNGSNSVSDEVGELEVAMSLAEMHATMQDDPYWESKALKSVADMGLECGDYASTILDFVKLYGGGAHAPHISFIDSIMKTFNATVALGEDMWAALTYSESPNKMEKLPLLRVALALINLTAGGATIIDKPHVQKAFSKQKAVLAAAAETALENSFEIISILGQTGVTQADVLAPLGHFFVRTGLLVVDMQLKGPEAKKYTMGEIKKFFLDDVSKVAGHAINFPEWSDDFQSGNSGPAAPRGSPEAARRPKAASSKACAAPASLSDLKSPIWIAAQAGFEAGSVVIEKKFGDAQSKSIPMEIVEINDDGEVKLRQALAYSPPTAMVVGTVQVSDLLLRWTHTSIQIPENFGSAVGGSSDVDMVRANLFIALMGLNGEHQSEAANSLQIWRKPDMVRTGATAIPKGGLVLVPMTTLNNITGGKKPGGAHVLLGNHAVEGVIVGFYGSAPAKPIADKGKNKQETFFSRQTAKRSRRFQRYILSGG